MLGSIDKQSGECVESVLVFGLLRTTVSLLSEFRVRMNQL